MNTLCTQLQDPEECGVYALSLADSREMFRVASQSGQSFSRIDLSQAEDKDSLLTLIADALYFPDWFENNWDAFIDCLADLSWVDADGHILVLCGLQNLLEQDSKTYDTLIEILDEICSIWRDDDVPFWVFIEEGGADLLLFQQAI